MPKQKTRESALIKLAALGLTAEKLRPYDWRMVSDEPMGGFVKVAIGAMLVWVIDNLSTLQIPEIAQVGLIAGLPIFD